MTDPGRVVLIGCEQSAGAAIRDLVAAGRSLPEAVEWVSSPCGGNIDALHILRAFESGADLVLVTACFDGACRSVNGNRWAEKRVEVARALLEEAGIPAWRLAFRNLAPNMAVSIICA